MDKNGRIPIIIGVTGHRGLREEDENALRAAVRKELAEIRLNCPNTPVKMLNSLAEGADQLCAEEALAAGIPVTAVLPMPLEEYEKDFDPVSLGKLHELIEACEDAFVAPDTEWTIPDSRDFLYRQAGIYVALHSHVLLALWDGQPGSIDGCGTADIVKVKLENTYSDKLGTGLHHADGAVIHIKARKRGEPDEEDNAQLERAGDISPAKSMFYGDRKSFEKMLLDTESYNSDVMNSAGIDYSAWSPADGCDVDGDRVIDDLSRLYIAADKLSLDNAKLHQRILAALAVSATLLTMAFLLYDEAELFWMIEICGVMVITLFVINAIARRLKSHKKYLEYRVLSECCRVQIYLRTAGVDCSVSEIMPWTLQVTTPWIRRALAGVMSGADVLSDRTEVKGIRINDQMAYHEKALVRSEEKQKRNDRIVKCALALTITVYIGALLFEIRYGGLISKKPLLDVVALNTIRTYIKLMMGTFSAGTLFASDYYGKQALPNVIDDHRKMILLYREAAGTVEREGEHDQLLIRLAQDELQENSNWYSYQSTNEADIDI